MDDLRRKRARSPPPPLAPPPRPWARPPQPMWAPLRPMIPPPSLPWTLPPPPPCPWTLPPPPRRPRISPPFYSEDDDNDGSHGHDDENDDGREEQEHRSRSGDDQRGGSSRDDTPSDGSGAADNDVLVTGAVAEVQPAAEEEDSDDDDRPISSVVSRLAAEEEDSDDDRPISIVSRPRTLVHQGSTSTASAAVPAPPESSPPAAAAAAAPPPVIWNAMLENSSAFDCSICYHPLKAPIFQCSVGHVVCSACHDKLGQATNCHVCRVPIPDGYLRCNAMEQVVDSIRVACPHAAHGCAEMPVYHDRDNHARTCAHKPCYCPGEGCGFAGRLQTTLLEHFADVHSWPCSAGTISSTVTAGSGGFDVHLRKGINIVAVTVGATTTFTTEQQYTLVLNVEAASVCNTITAFCINPSKTGTVSLGLSYEIPCVVHYAGIQQVVCTDLSNGMPARNSCSPFFVPRCSSAPGEDEQDIRVTIKYISST